jgi:hypothetical protein
MRRAGLTCKWRGSLQGDPTVTISQSFRQEWEEEEGRQRARVATGMTGVGLQKPFRKKGGVGRGYEYAFEKWEMLEI